MWPDDLFLRVHFLANVILVITFSFTTSRISDLFAFIKIRITALNFRQSELHFRFIGNKKIAIPSLTPHSARRASPLSMSFLSLILFDRISEAICICARSETLARWDVIIMYLRDTASGCPHLYTCIYSRPRWTLERLMSMPRVKSRHARNYVFLLMMHLYLAGFIPGWMRFWNFGKAAPRATQWPRVYNNVSSLL